MILISTSVICVAPMSLFFSLYYTTHKKSNDVSNSIVYCFFTLIYLTEESMGKIYFQYIRKRQTCYKTTALRQCTQPGSI